MSTLSLRMVIDQQEKTFDFTSTLSLEGVIRSTDKLDVQVSRSNGFGTFICLTDKADPASVKLYIVGRSGKGYNIVRAGDWMFLALATALKGFGLIRAKDLDAARKKNAAAVENDLRQTTFKEAKAILMRAGIVLNQKQEARLRQYAKEKVKQDTPKSGGPV